MTKETYVNKELDRWRSICCKAKYKHIGRAHYVCEKCGDDVTLHLLLLVDLLEDEFDNKKKRSI